MREMRQKIATIPSGRHACLFFDTPEQRMQATVPFLQIGIEKGERCLFLADASTVEVFLSAFQAAGTDPDPLISRGALIATSERGFLRDGRFDADKTIEFLDTAVEQALKDGFTGFRATGDMVWEMGPDGDTAHIAHYEAKLDRFFCGKRLTGLCQYCRPGFAAMTLVDAVRTHPVVVRPGVVTLVNPAYREEA